jgi:uncharacterized protein
MSRYDLSETELTTVNRRLLVDMSSLTVDRIVADGDHAFGLIRLSTTSGDRAVRLAELSILREGKVAEMEIFVHDDAGLLDRTRPARS